MKRIYKKTKCANPLFEQWLEEWKEESIARDSPLQHSFGKALNSLRKFPIPLATGKDCNVLEYFGPKICVMLDKKLDQYRKANNLPADASQTCCYEDGIKDKRKKKIPENNQPSTSGLNDSKSKNGSKSQENGQGTEKNKQIRKTQNRQYIPKVGSGAYALLITLYKNTKEDPNKPDFMLKKDLIAESKFYCDAPMKQTATEHYSGWSSMSTLIEKNLVKKKSNPAKYSLTDAGFALALQLSESPSAQDENDENLCNESSLENASKNNKDSKSGGSHSSCELYMGPKNFSSLSPKKRTVSEINKESKSPDSHSSYNFNSVTTFSEENYDILKSPKPKTERIVYSNSSCESKQSLKSFSTSLEKDCDIIVLDNEDDDDDVFENPPVNHDNIKTPNDIENLETDHEFQMFCKENVESVTPIKKKPNVLYSILDCPSNLIQDQEINTLRKQQLNKPDSTGKRTISNKTNDSASCTNTSPKKGKVSTLPTTSAETHKKNIDFDRLETGDVDSSTENKLKYNAIKEKGTDNATKLTTTNSKKTKKKASVETPTETFYLLPNNFDIILLVDTQETSGGKTRPKDDATISELSALQTVFEIRSLKVGDFAWIARCRFTNKELILPYIVERKRIDDLASSIKDGRYHEQKFRLRQSGIKNVIYLIENYGTTYHGCMPITSLFQAAVNSLVQDNFQVKFTKDHKDSMSYLATITKMLMEIYEGKELISCKKKDIELENADSSNISLMEFSEFNKSAMKTKNFKVKEMLIRQLLQLKGLSVDKAIAITDFYPTPKVLCEALKNSDEKLLANIEAGLSKHKIGPAISKTIWQFYTQNNFA